MKKHIIDTYLLQRVVNTLEALPFKDVNALLGEVLANAREVTITEEKPSESSPRPLKPADLSPEEQTWVDSLSSSSAPTSGPEAPPAPKKRGRPKKTSNPV